MSVIDYQFLRNLTLFILSALSVFFEKRNPFKEFPSRDKWTVATRIFTGQAAFFIYYCALSMTPLTIITVVTKLDAFFVFMLAYIINGERIVLLEIMGMFICFGTIFAISKSESEKNVAGEDITVEEAANDQRILGLCLGIVVAIFAGTTSVLNRTLKHVPTSLIMLYHGAAGMIVSGVYVLFEAYFTGNDVKMLSYSSGNWLGIAISTFFNSVTVACHTIAFKSDSSGFIVLMGNVSVLYFFFADTFLFHEVFTSVELIGTVVIMTVIICIAACRTKTKTIDLTRQKSL